MKLSELLHTCSLFLLPTEPKVQNTVSSQEYIISTNLTISLLTILAVLHFTPLLWLTTQSSTLGPGGGAAAEGPTASGSGTVFPAPAPDFLATLLQVSLVGVAAVILTMSLVLPQVFVWQTYSFRCHFPWLAFHYRTCSLLPFKTI